MAKPTPRQLRLIIKPLCFLLCLAPFLWLLLGAFELPGLGLGADPIEAIQDNTGIWALRLLLVTLAITPLRMLTGAVWLTQLRRMLGLFSLFYASMHFANYLTLDQGFAWPEILEDIVDRPFITIGALALLAMVPLGITSTKGWRIRLGRRWNTLHRLIYGIAILACWHYWWQVKSEAIEPAIYAAILTGLLLTRVWRKART